MTEFLLAYIHEHGHRWKHQPAVFAGEDFQDCLVLVFGKPRTAVFAHIDSIGFTVRYNRQLVRIGSPHFESGTELVGHDREERLPVRFRLTMKVTGTMQQHENWTAVPT